MSAFNVLLHIKKSHEKARVASIRISTAASREEAIGIATKLVTPNYGVLKIVACEEATS